MNILYHCLMLFFYLFYFFKIFIKNINLIKNSKKSFLSANSKLIFFDVLMNLIKETNQLFSSVIISKSDSYSSVTIEYQSFNYLINLNNSLLNYFSIDIFYYKLFLHLCCFLVKYEQISWDCINNLLCFILELKTFRCCSF